MSDENDNDNDNEDFRSGAVLPGSGVPFTIELVRPPPRLVEERPIFGAPYTQDELDDAQARFGLRFPPDLLDLFRTHRLAQGYDWAKDFEAITDALNCPYEGILFDVEHNRLWWPEWGERPAAEADRAARLREVMDTAPKLIPLSGHRYLPEAPHEAGNPVFSVHQADIIHYGVDLAEWILADHPTDEMPVFDRDREPRWIEFWSEMVTRARYSTREEADVGLADFRAMNAKYAAMHEFARDLPETPETVEMLFRMLREGAFDPKDT